jgi:hypothetical protein
MHNHQKHLVSLCAVITGLNDTSMVVAAAPIAEKARRLEGLVSASTTERSFTTSCPTRLTPYPPCLPEPPDYSVL